MTKESPRLNAFPIFMRVVGEAVVIVGNGDEALAKARRTPNPPCANGSRQAAQSMSRQLTRRRI